MNGLPWWKNRRLLTMAMITLGLVVVTGLVLTSARILQQQSTSVWARRFVRVVPVPAAYVDGRIILYRDLLPHWDAIDRYLESDPVIAQQEGMVPQARSALRQEAFERLIRQKVIERRARASSFAFDESAVAANMEALLVSPDGTTSTREQVAAAIEAEIGWTIDQYREWLVRPAVYEEGLRQFIWSTSTQESWDAQVASWVQGIGARRFLSFSRENP